jgi:hypothetical protein
MHFQICHVMRYVFRFLPHSFQHRMKQARSLLFSNNLFTYCLINESANNASIGDDCRGTMRLDRESDPTRLF